jgi:hypothetical protein
MLLTRVVEVQVDFLAPKSVTEAVFTLSEIPAACFLPHWTAYGKSFKSFVDAISLDARQFVLVDP